MGAAAVGEDHAEPAARRGHRHAAQRLDAAQARVALGHPARELARHLDHAILGQRNLRDRRLLERAVHLGQEAGLDSVAPHHDHELARVVVEQQARAVHRAEPAAGLAEAVVELAARLRGPVERTEEPDDHVERIRAR